MINKGIVSLVLTMGLGSAAAFAGCGDKCDPCPPKPSCEPCKPKCDPCPKPACDPCPKPACDPCPPKPCCVPKPVNGSECGCVNGGPGSPLDCNLVPAAYNKAANIQIQCGTDFYITADFLYWEALQDGMDLVIDTTNAQTDLASETTTQVMKFEKFSYKPAFKVGLGYSSGFDGWELYAQYTWYHHQFNSSFTGPNGDVPSLDNYLTAQYEDDAPTGDDDFATSYSSRWKLGIDIADLSVLRPSYVGTNLVLTPSFGLRAAWIRQNLNGSSANFDNDTISITASRTQTYKTHSWAIGPRAGLASSWLLGCGFRLIGNGYASILYTSYTEAQINFTDTIAADVAQSYNSNYHALRAMTELDIGLGWGDYYCDQTYYFDVAVTYDFNVFWNQNMMRHMNNQFNAFSADAPGNLYLHGLTVEARLDF
jgi:hypothetical protein